MRVVVRQGFYCSTIRSPVFPAGLQLLTVAEANEKLKAQTKIDHQSKIKTKFRKYLHDMKLNTIIFRNIKNGMLHISTAMTCRSFVESF